MRLLHVLIALVVLGIFLRPDMQLFDLVLGANLIWSGAAAVLLICILIGRFSANWPTRGNTAKLAFWGLVVTGLLGLVEYSLEWRKPLKLAYNQTITLPASPFVTDYEHITRSGEGLFRTKAWINGQPLEMFLDTGATLVLLNYETAQQVGVDMAALDFSVPVVTVSGPQSIAKIVLDKISVGNIELRHVDAAVSPPGYFHSNLLGNSFLARLDGADFKAAYAVLKLKRK